MVTQCPQFEKVLHAQPVQWGQGQQLLIVVNGLTTASRVQCYLFGDIHSRLHKRLRKGGVGMHGGDNILRGCL